MDVYFDSATWDYSKNNWLCGRGNNTGFPSGMFAPGTLGDSFGCNWKDGTNRSLVSMAGQSAGWYRAIMVVYLFTHQQFVINLQTGAMLIGSAELNGSSTVGEADNFTLFSYGIGGYTGAYGSVGVNISNVKITRDSDTIFNLPLGEGATALVTDVVSKTRYSVGFFTSSIGWAKLSDYSHYNFKNGFTLYQKSGNPDFYVPNDIDGTEIVLTLIPFGYTRIANHKGTTTTFNQCESSKFKLDDVDILSDLYLADVDHVLFTEGTGVAKEFDISTFDVNNGFNRGYMYINPNIEQHDFLMYKTDKTLNADVKVIKYIGLGDEIVYDEENNVVYDENDHAILV
jgi:hypothetical protein